MDENEPPRPDGPSKSCNLNVAPFSDFVTVSHVDFSNPEVFERFLALYGALPRAAPGSDDATRTALNAVPMGPQRNVLDLGCGPGAQTLSLADALPESTIVALDVLPSMIIETARRSRAAAAADRIIATVADMAAPPVAHGSQDLIWSEGAIYFLGVTAALRTWRPYLTDGGRVAFTESVWLQNDPDEEIANWWYQQYPAITDVAGVRQAILDAGFRVIDSFVLPADAWWNEYYGPMEARIPEFLAEYGRDEISLEVAAAAEEEISMFRRFNESYSYAFFIACPES
jgi:trans-aconitate methyltransferase